MQGGSAVTVDNAEPNHGHAQCTRHATTAGLLYLKTSLFSSPSFLQTKHCGNGAAQDVMGEGRVG